VGMSKAEEDEQAALCGYPHKASYSEDRIMRTPTPDVGGDQGFRRRRLTDYGMFTGSRGTRERGQVQFGLRPKFCGLPWSTHTDLTSEYGASESAPSSRP
jgi:hypothetical protein